MYKCWSFQIVQSLLFVLNDYENPRVQAHAGAALVNFSEGCPKAILSIYLDSIIAKLDEVLAKKINEVRKQDMIIMDNESPV